MSVYRARVITGEDRRVVIDISPVLEVEAMTYTGKGIDIDQQAESGVALTEEGGGGGGGGTMIVTQA
jgi:hypothetical protein